MFMSELELLLISKLSDFFFYLKYFFCNSQGGSPLKNYKLIEHNIKELTWSLRKEWTRAKGGQEIDPINTFIM